MPQYSLNNVVPEPERSLEDRGFNGMVNTTERYLTHNYSPPLPQGAPSPLQNDVNASSNTTNGDFPTAAGEFARRTK